MRGLCETGLYFGFYDTIVGSSFDSGLIEGRCDCWVFLRDLTFEFGEDLVALLFLLFVCYYSSSISIVPGAAGSMGVEAFDLFFLSFIDLFLG